MWETLVYNTQTRKWRDWNTCLLMGLQIRCLEKFHLLVRCWAIYTTLRTCILDFNSMVNTVAWISGDTFVYENWLIKMVEAWWWELRKWMSHWWCALCKSSPKLMISCICVFEDDVGQESTRNAGKGLVMCKIWNGLFSQGTFCGRVWRGLSLSNGKIQCLVWKMGRNRLKL